jgi:Sulfotransferase family
VADAHIATGTSARGPIFIVGPMGSGTTLLRLIVDSHDNIAIAQETSIMRGYLAHKWIPFSKAGAWYRRLGWSDEELDDRMREFYTGMFERFAKEQGKQRWGDKTPWHTWHLRQTAELFPDAVFIATIRHPGAVAASVSGRFDWKWRRCVLHWVANTTELVHRGGELGDRFLLCRYEDLVLEPESTLRELFEWLGEPWSPRLLEHHLVHSERGTPPRVEGSSRSDEPISASRISSWTRNVTEENWRVLRQEAGALAPFYGYDVDMPDELQPMSVAGSSRRRTLTGTEVNTRRKQFQDLVELDRTFAPWAGNRMLKPQLLRKLGRALKAEREMQVTLPPPAPQRLVAARARTLVNRARRRVRSGGGRPQR